MHKLFHKFKNMPCGIDYRNIASSFVVKSARAVVLLTLELISKIRKTVVVEKRLLEFTASACLGIQQATHAKVEDPGPGGRRDSHSNFRNQLKRGNFEIASLVKISLIGILICSSSGCAHFHKDKDTLYQVSTIDALLNASYDGSVEIRKLKRHGDFGIGTFDQLDGEMIVLDGVFYKIKSDGTIVQVDDSETTPFCALTFFEKERTIELQPGMKFNQISASLFNSPNYFYAIRIEGKFRKISARSVPKQTKPYPMLVEVVKSQPVFNLENVEGTAVGFFCPAFAKGLNVPGFHMHFISADRKSGGHILDFEIEKAEMQIDETSKFMLVLPENDTFGKLDLAKDKEKELNKVEK